MTITTRTVVAAIYSFSPNWKIRFTLQGPGVPVRAGAGQEQAGRWCLLLPDSVPRLCRGSQELGDPRDDDVPQGLHDLRAAHNEQQRLQPRDVVECRQARPPA